MVQTILSDRGKTERLNFLSSQDKSDTLQRFSTIPWWLYKIYFRIKFSFLTILVENKKTKKYFL